jgi:acid stress-induced BolA-like protein IbaG/YrbA
MTAEEIQRLIEDGLPGATVSVSGDDGVHFEAHVVAVEFAGLNRVQCHQLVYRTLGSRMGTQIHALALKTYTPEQWTQAQST